MDIFQKAIDHEGGLSNLAKTLFDSKGHPLTSSRVGNWRHKDRRVPDGWLAVLVARYGALPDVPATQRKRKLPGQAVVSGAK